MLEVTKTRQTVANFFVGEGEEKTLVKTTVINTDHEAVSILQETLHNPELYARHRKDMRQDEAKLREIRYAIEDDILAELEEEVDVSE